MGLGPQGPILAEWKTRGYITVLRRNWHLVPTEQLLTLLDMPAEELAYSLREDDFLSIKLGPKPECPPVAWSPPEQAAQRATAEIKRIVEETFRGGAAGPEEPRFAFVDRLGRRREMMTAPSGEPKAARSVATRRGGCRPRYIYSYFAMYGDPLIDPELDPYPDGLLQRLSAAGVNGVWLHMVLRTLAPSGGLPGVRRGARAAAGEPAGVGRRAGRYGIGV